MTYRLVACPTGKRYDFTVKLCDLPMSGMTCDCGGVVSATNVKKKVNDSNEVTDNETFSPDSGGR